jgi:hypothetical protein
VALKLPIQKAMVRWLFAWRPDTLPAAAHRARLLTVVVQWSGSRLSRQDGRSSEDGRSVQLGRAEGRGGRAGRRSERLG